MCVFLSCLPASEHFRSDVGKTKEGSIPPLVYSIADHTDKQVSPQFLDFQFISMLFKTYERSEVRADCQKVRPR